MNCRYICPVGQLVRGTRFLTRTSALRFFVPQYAGIARTAQYCPQSKFRYVHQFCDYPYVIAASESNVVMEKNELLLLVCPHFFYFCG